MQEGSSCLEADYISFYKKNSGVSIQYELCTSG